MVVLRRLASFVRMRIKTIFSSHPTLLMDACVIFVHDQDRRITQSELERVRDVLEREVANLKEELRSTVSFGHSLKCGNSFTCVWPIAIVEGKIAAPSVYKKDNLETFLTDHDRKFTLTLESSELGGRSHQASGSTVGV